MKIPKFIERFIEDFANIRQRRKEYYDKVETVGFDYAIAIPFVIAFVWVTLMILAMTK